jgi:tetratricopeptide (TPR) repeat protein
MTNENNQGINIKGGKNEIKDNTFIFNSPEKAVTAVKYIPYPSIPNFVGRSEELIKIHEKFQQKNAIAISAVAGMGGVGKTELAVKYAREHTDDYPGGICWLNARDTNIAAEIIQFVQLQMGLEVPQQDFQGNVLTLIQQVAWCWQHWQPADGLVLVVFDDVTNLDGFAELLPINNRFRVLMTTRLRNLDTNIQEIPLDVLSPEEALELLINLVGEKKVNKELETAKELCKWLGYLPLGIELVGRYLVKKPPHFTLGKMLEQLKQQRLHQEAINTQQKGLSTAQFGVLAAFEISWVELNQETQQVAALLSLFAADIFVWEWIKLMTQSLNWDESDVEIAIEQLYQRHLVQCLEEEGEYYYKIHPLIREFLQLKLIASAESNEFKQAFASAFIEIAQSIPDSATLELINSVKNAIPHLTEVAESLTDAVSDENLIWVFTGLARFYKEQGLYALAEPWYERCVSAVKFRLGENHPLVAQSLNDLAVLYYYQGRYEAAEPLLIQALELRKQLLGENHTDVTESLNNLANIYESQGKYEEAKPLFLQALELRKQLLGEIHPDVATSLNNLAELYRLQGKYEAAEPIHIQALQLYKQLLGENHPDYATSLNNLAVLYNFQGKYDRAEPLFLQTLELRKSILGENHPSYAISLNNLAVLYDSQGKYEAAEPLYLQALELTKSILGENHPDIASSLNNLADIYRLQGKYEAAEPLYIQALQLTKQLLGENHPSTATSLNNLALLYKSQGKYEAAEPLYLQALELRKSILGENHPSTATSLNNLAKLYYSQGRYEEAEPLYLQALELRKSILGENHPDYATSLNNLAELYQSQEKCDRAEPLFIQTLEICDRTLGTNHPNTVTIRGNLEYLRTLQQENRE